MKKLVYLSKRESKRDRGLYYIDGGKWYFPDRVMFKDAREGLAWVEVINEKETFGFVKGEMIPKCDLVLDECGSLLSEHGDYHWNLSDIEGVKVAWLYNKSFHLFVNGVIYNNFGSLESWMFDCISNYSSIRALTLGYYISKIIQSSTKLGDPKDCLDEEKILG